MDNLNQPSQAAEQPRQRVPWLRWVGTMIALGLLVYLLAQQGWDEFAQAIVTIPAWVILAAFVCLFGSRLTTIGRWLALLRAADVSISIWDAFKLVFAGLFASNFLPTTIGGDVVRLAGAVQLRLDAGIVTASLIVDRLVGMAGMATLLPLELPRVLREGFPALTGNPTHETLVAITFPGILQPLWKKLLGFIETIWKSLVHWVRRPFGLLHALLWTYGHMACVFGAVWFLLLGMGEPLSFWKIGGLWVLAYFITLLPVSINGLGLQELSIAVLYTTFGGVSEQTGLALAVLMRMLYMLASLPGVFFLPGLLQRRSQASLNHGNNGSLRQ
jgi:uncharacterized membrane protein YbhN (UPF0104 family)